MKGYTITLGLAMFSAAPAAATMNLDTRNVTVSGLSSGGYMANQFHIAHSDWVKGAAIISAGPYYCAQNDITIALGACVDKSETEIPLDVFASKAKKWADEGKIADLNNLKNHRVWLFHGTKDERVAQSVTDTLHKQYQSWLNADTIEYVRDKPFGHLFPTRNSGVTCDSSASPYIGDCGYDAAGKALSHLLENVTAPDDTLTGEVVTFDQAGIGGKNAETLAKTGYAYVPKSCKEGNDCQVHVSFHGCDQYANEVGKAYVDNAGFNRWADDNNLVVIYPQTKKSLFMPLNPQGCWDWWGYTGADYATRDGAQIKAVKAFIDSFARQ
ncbi:extracellular catalytic domain type 2 short-chain-length polyhydroxyalkanoate depolymerase [Salinimonas chungwhensis]|uniref:extracellular catalytic domain type 2 short-chain-length polyhydroxyalkanoate depolymerase n=1 Tax=Salinimonas chungwhensis TaxID=265425 RepID=UPI000373D959|nr:PHB depolymerase family esterase [Salinimonas chungwhensis]